MTRALVALTVQLLEHRLGRRWMGGKHTRECGRGQFDGTGNPDGRPCSDPCQWAQVALAGWQAQLVEMDGQVPRQLVMDVAS